MGAQTGFPLEMRVGRDPHVEVMELRPDELLLAFTEGFDDARIATVLSARGLVEHGADTAMLERVRSQGMRWVDVRSGRPAREVARSCLTEVPECWLASPVYAPRSNPTEPNAAAPIPSTLIVLLDDTGSSATLQAIMQLGLHLDGQWSELLQPLYRFHLIGAIPDDGFDLLAQVAAVAGVALVEFDWLRLDPVQFTPATTYWNEQWNLQRMQMPTAWPVTIGCSEVVIAVIDTGFDLEHPSLLNAFGPPETHAFYSGKGPGPPVLSGDAQVPMIPTAGMTTTNDIRWHGTAVAGIIAGSPMQGLGVAGIAPACRIMPVRVEPMSDANLAAGVGWARTHGARVVNLSVGGAGPTIGLEYAVRGAWLDGLVICAASGTGGPSEPPDAPVVFPAAFPEVIAVGACAEDDQAKVKGVPGDENWFSKYGPELDVMAPGIRIPSTDARADCGYNQGGPGRSVQWFARTYGGVAAGDLAGDYLCVFTGTSAATPHVSGLAGLLFSQHPSRDNQRVRDIIEDLCDEVGPPGSYPIHKKPYSTKGWSQVMGYGRINAARALSQPP